MNKALQTYARVNAETSVAAATPHKLIALLFQGIMSSLLMANKSIETGDIKSRTKFINKAIMMIEEGLRASLDRDRGADVSKALDDLYSYSVRKLMFANSKNDAKAVLEVKGLLTQVQEAWTEVGKSSSAAAR